MCSKLILLWKSIYVYLYLCFYLFVFGGAFQESTDMNPNMEDGAYQYLENSRWDILSVAQRTYVWVVPCFPENNA